MPPKTKIASELARLGCVLCYKLGYPGTPANIHHLREGMGMGQRNDDDHAIPLCHYHHQGPKGYHGLGKRGFEREYGCTELDLLDLTGELLCGR